MKHKLDKRGDRKVHNGKYHIKHPEKYKGNAREVYYRSMWEKQCFIWLDGHPQVEWWNSEEFVVPYYYEVDKKNHRYYIDLAVKWKSGKTSLIEVKPKKQVEPPKIKKPRSKRSLTEAYTYIKNMNKWEAADKIAKDNGWEFIIWTEEELKKYGILKKQPGKLNPLPRYTKKKKLT